MERYTVTVVHPDNSGTTQLLIPLHHDQPVAALLVQVARRFTKRSSSPIEPTFELHLWQEDGPVVDEDDLLKEVALDPRLDIIFATAMGRPEAAAREQSMAQDSKRIVVSHQQLEPLHQLATTL